MIQIEIAQHVLALPAPAALDRLLEAPLELAPVDQSAERIVRRLVRHLARDAAHLGHIVQQHHSARQLARTVADRGSRQLDRALAAVGTRQQQRPAAEVHGRPAGERLVDRVGEHAPVGLIDQTHDILQVLADRCPGLRAGELLGRRIEEGDQPLLVGGDDRLGDGLERQLLRFGCGIAQSQYLVRLRRNDLDPGDQQRAALVVVHHGRGNLQAAQLPVQPDHVDLVALGGGLAGEAAADVVAHQLGVLGGYEVREPPPDELEAIDADEACELPVRVQDDFAVHQHRLVNALAEVGEQLGRVGAVALGDGRGARQQMIDRGHEGAELGIVALYGDPSGQPSTDGNALQLLGELRQLMQVAPLQRVQDQDQGGDSSAQQAQQADNRHSCSSQPLARVPLRGPQALLLRLVSRLGSTDVGSIAQADPRPVGISPYLVAWRLGSAPENP